jgi:hypothetical protein
MSVLDIPPSTSPASSAYLDRDKRQQLLTAVRGALAGIRQVEDNLRNLEDFIREL